MVTGPNWVLETFDRTPALIGVLHLPPLPGSPRAALAMEEVWEFVRKEAAIYREEGLDGLLLENHGDAPFPREGNEAHVGSD